MLAIMYTCTCFRIMYMLVLSVEKLKISEIRTMEGTRRKGGPCDIFYFISSQLDIIYICLFFTDKKNLSCPQLLNNVLNSSSVITVFLPHYIIGLFLFSLLLPSLTRQSAQPYFLHREMQAILVFRDNLWCREKTHILFISVLFS